MRVCPQCKRENKPQARFCDQCGFEFSAAVVAALPPEDTAKGIPPVQAGVPQQLRGTKGVYRQTQKIDTPVVAAGTPTDRSAHNQSTVKVARVPAPSRDGSGPRATASQAPAAPVAPAAPAPPAPADPAPEATIQGAFYLRKQEAGRAASAEEHVAWLVESDPGNGSRGVWPVTAGPTFIGSSPEEVGRGVVADRGALAPLHALLFHRKGMTWLVDLASPSGTAVNGKQLPPLIGHLLGDRDELQLGELVLSFRSADPTQT